MPPTSPPPEGLKLPSRWSKAAKETAETIFAERPDMSAADMAQLEAACEMQSAADRLELVARHAGWISTGSTGQVVAHPAAVEARLNRTAAAAILARLSVSASGKTSGQVRSRANLRTGRG